MSDARTVTTEGRQHGLEESERERERAGKHRGVAAAQEEPAAEPHGKHRRPSMDQAS
ncbi:hypothetical protein GCM10010387_13880 [Streptomyces inusitatus]|uniref:Uncharacterized protein n=1 Tax=Streptomyces inusitatus TaxID=68221 RepID=A0A918UN50_9ACTN|nr:hypothetical protein [Streptomyces inusitatus]GGZ21963.1 hypothetical protein GCM10010387_13880 [Streptomyces inusitatus]